MMNRTMQLNHSASAALCSASALPYFAYYAASFFSALRFYFYSFFHFTLPPERKSVC